MGAETAAAYLLMTAKGHGPGGEGHEEEAIGTKVTYCLRQEQGLLKDMLYDVVAYHYVKSLPQVVQTEDVCGYETTCLAVSGEKAIRLIYPAPGYIDTGDTAAHLGKRQQVAAFAAAYLQYALSWLDGMVPLYIRNQECSGSKGELCKILLPVCVTLLHRNMFLLNNEVLFRCPSEF